MMPPLHPTLVREIIYPAYRKLRGDRLLARLEELERNQWLSRNELDDILWRRIEYLIQQATKHVPYYSALFRDAGLRPEDIQSPDDLRRIPFLTKEIMRAESGRFVTEDPLRRGYPSSTGGSTGEPLYFHNDWAASPLRRANTIRSYRWADADIGDRQALLWGFTLDSSAGKRLIESIRNYFNNIMPLSTFDLSDRSIERHASRLRRFGPDYIVGYPSALALLSEYCTKNSLALPRTKSAVTSGEQLFPHQREEIEKAFTCRVFDRYGSREFGNVAHECGEHEGLHVFTDLFFVEVVHDSGRPAQSGETGEIVVTDPLNLYMPFIRYRTGDLAVRTDRACPCGRGFPLLERIEGRAFDAIVTPSGKRVGGFFWTWLSRAVPGIERFQIEQRDPNGATLRIVPGPEWKDENRRTLSDKIADTCGEGFEVRFEIVDEIPLTRSGKSRFIISDVKLFE